jgi:hypothetical protein
MRRLPTGARSVEAGVPSSKNNPIVDYTGPTAYSGKNGYPAPGSFYFKTGFHRDSMAKPMMIYVDDYRKQQLPAIDL